MTVISQFHKYLFSICFSIALLGANNSSAAVVFQSLNTSHDQSRDPSQKGKAEAIQGGLLLGKTAPGNRVRLDEQNVRVAADGSFVIGFGRDITSAELFIDKKNGEQQRELIQITPRKYKIDRLDGLPPSKVNPKGEAVLKRIRQESSLIKLVRTRDDERQDFSSGFIWPAKGRISGVYGSQRILNGEPKWPHYGLDIAAPTGTVVIAPASGIVTMAHNDMYYSGGTLIIDHGHGLSSTFLHLSKILVKSGEYIKQGTPIAKIGATGRVTGPHLDWRINWFKVRLDPQRLVDGIPMSKTKIQGK